MPSKPKSPDSTVAQKIADGRVTPKPYDDDEEDPGYAPLNRPPAEAPGQSVAESMGRAITAPVRDAAQPEDRRQTGKNGKG